MPIHGNDNRSFGALVGQRDELTLQIQKMSVASNLAAQNIVTMVVTKILVGV